MATWLSNHSHIRRPPVWGLPLLTFKNMMIQPWSHWLCTSLCGTHSGLPKQSINLYSYVNTWNVQFGTIFQNPFTLNWILQVFHSSKQWMAYELTWCHGNDISSIMKQLNHLLLLFARLLCSWHSYVNKSVTCKNASKWHFHCFYLEYTHMYIAK